MNERIQELLKKSTYDVLGVKQVDQKQFAELLISDCINTLHQRGWTDAGNDLKEHFEVKQ